MYSCITFSNHATRDLVCASSWKEEGETEKQIPEERHKFDIQNTALTSASEMGTSSKQWLSYSGAVQMAHGQAINTVQMPSKSHGNTM